MSALFTGMLNDVYSLTNRADLITESKLAIKQATQDAHRSDFYQRDLADGIQVAITPATPNWQISISQNFPLWRAFSYLRPFTVSTLTLSKIVIGRNQFLTPEAILDEYLEERLNVAYVAGDNLNARLETAYDGLLVAYYKNPQLQESPYDSWIAQDYPEIIQIDAARRVFGMIGYEEAAARFTQIMFGNSNGSWLNIMGGAAATFRAAVLEGAA